VPSLARAPGKVALGSIAGIGVNRPGPDTPLAKRLTGTDVSGVSYRVQAQHGVTTASLAAGAARAALQAGGKDPAELEMIVVATTSPDVLWPSTACLVQTELGLPMVAAFDLYAAQTSLLSALDVAAHYLTAGARSILLIGAESDNQLVDLAGQSSSHLARAAAAALLTPAAGSGGLLSTVSGGAAVNSDAQQQGAVKGLVQGVDKCLAKAQLRIDDIALVIGDSSAPEIMRGWSEEAQLSHDRLLLDPARYGGLLAAAPLVALYDAAQSGRLGDGMNFLMLESGAGPSWAAACFRWSKTGVAAC
jgi:3-oxoacyl-[acyl-carrier-protein] synthase-3